MEREIVGPTSITDRDGRLVRDAVGWARHPIFECRLAPDLPRVHRWNHWCLTTRTHLLQITIADVGFLGLVIVTIIDLARPSPIERIYARLGGLPIALPDTPGGDIVLKARRLALSMITRGEQMHVEGDVRTLFGRRITIDLSVDRPRAHETLNVLVPFDGERFQFTSKQQALRVRGTVRVDAREYRFEKDAFACLDFGRGRWPNRIHWYWAFASGAIGGRTIGFNLGGKWTDGTGVTENGAVIDGRLHKISDDVDFVHDSFLRPWRLRTRRSDLVDLTFTPTRERTVRIPLLLANAELHQCVGTFSGKIVGIPLDGMLGLSESFRGRW
jgi:hypothetical protein